MAQSNLGSSEVAQIAIVVHDIEEACRRWSDVLGQQIPNIILTEPGSEVGMTYNGRESNAQAKLAFFNLGAVQLELIQPVGGPSAWQEALDSGGEHVQHIAFWVDGMQRSVDFLRERGIPMVQRGDMMANGQYAYLDSKERLGVTLELLERKRETRATY